MTGSTFPPLKQSDAAVYEIRVQGHLDERWAESFYGMTLTQEMDAQTILRGIIADQSALHGALTKIRDLGLSIISVKYLGPQGDATSPSEQAHSEDC
jgi:hypothetical protein